MNKPDFSESQPLVVPQPANSRTRRFLRRLGLAFLVFAMAVALCVFVHLHPKLFTTMAGVARILIFFPLAVVSAWIIVGNWVCTIAALTTKRSYSQVPLVGGLLGVMACRCGPEAIRPYAWVPLLLDLGTLVVPYTLVWLLVRWVSRKIRGR